MVIHSNLDDKTLKKAREELNEIPEERASHIETLRRWVDEQPHITSRTDDAFLLRFLRVAKFSQLRAQEILENFCTVRSVEGKGAPDWFAGIDPLNEKQQEILDLGLSLPLPGTDDEGRTLLLINTGGYDPVKHDFADVMRAGFMTTDVLLMDEVMQVNGVVTILDFGEFTAAHVYNFSRDIVQKSMKCWTDTYPTRNKGANYYRTPTVVNALQDLFMYFMKEKLKKRLHFHKDSLESLQTQVPKRMLPTEYGGDAGPLEDMKREWKKKVIENRDEIMKNNICKVDESKRPAAPEAAAGEGWGIVGSFRKLTTS